MSGFRVTGANGVDPYYSAGPAGIYLNKANYSNISNNTASNNHFGISLQYSSNNTLIDNNASNNNNRGIFLWYSSNNTLTGNNANSNNIFSGINLWYSSYNTLIANNASKNKNSGILIFDSSNNTLISNNADSNNHYGIQLSLSNNNTLTANNANSNNYLGIELSSSSHNTLTDNIMITNEKNFRVLADYDNEIDTTNLVNDKPIYYIKNSVNTVYDQSTNAGTFYCINCINVTVKDMNLTENGEGLTFWNTSFSRIQNINASNNLQGIYLSFSSNNTLSGNKASNNINGFNLEDGMGHEGESGNNTMIGNNASNNDYGISLFSSNNTLIGNNVNSNNNYGIILDVFSNNKINNNIFNNIQNFRYDTLNGANYWNNTKTSGTNIIGGSYLGGNFWANPSGTGFSQICTNRGDGFCSQNYTLNVQNIDYLPLTSNVVDAIAPASVANLTNITYAPNYINWTWTDPEDSDFLKVMIYINGIFQTNVTNGTQYYNSTGLIENTLYEISTHTVDTSGNINQTWVNRTAMTAPSISGQRTITVDDSGGADYTRIQDAIDNASALDTILVYSSTYFENVNVTKQLILRGVDNGAGQPVVDAGGSGNAITLSADGITLDGFIARNASGWLEIGMPPDAGIEVYSNNNSIINNNASNNGYGIHLNSSSNNTLSGNNASNNEYGFGIILESSSNNILSNNIANSNDHTGIRLEYSSNNTLSGNNASNNFWGISMSSSSNNKFINNIFNNTNNNIYTFGYQNYWNTSKTSGTNIIGGSYLAGNFWANPSGTGYSQTCADDDGDGICNSPYVLTENNTDYLPLSMNFTSDTTPPLSITNLQNITYAQTYINWTWTDPIDPDFSKVMIYINGAFQTNVTNGTQYFNATGLIENLQYNISTHTVDTSGNINQTWVNRTARTAPPSIPSEIRGIKFNDSNGNRVKDAGEPGVSGVEIHLTRMISPGVEYLAGTAFTNVSGNYNFTGLSQGLYRIEELPGELVQTFPANGMPYFINLEEGEIRTGIDFGNMRIIPGEVRGMKFNDSNGNGLLDDGENGMPGINICLYPSWKCTVTDGSGNYTLSGVSPGSYIVYEYMPSEYVATTPIMVEITVNSGEMEVINFGNRLPVPLSPDVSIAQQSGEQNGVPTVFRPDLTVLTISRNLTNISENVVSVKLTMNWSDGTSRNASMIEIGSTNIWTADFDAPFPGGIAQMKFEVDVSPAGQGPEDAIQIGDIIFIDPSGVIKNSCSGDPISGAAITLLYDYPTGNNNFIPSPPENQIPGDNPLITGVDGRYSWLTVPGIYKVRAEKTGYFTNESDPVTVPPPVTDLNISLIPTGGCGISYNLTGSVFNASSLLGIPGALVKLDAYPQYNATTNNSGVYNMSVPAGTYQVNASVARYVTNTTTLTINAIVCGTLH